MATDGRLQKAVFTTAQSIHLCFANNLSLTGSLQEPVGKLIGTAADLKRSHKQTVITSSRYFQTAKIFLPKFRETMQHDECLRGPLKSHLKEFLVFLTEFNSQLCSTKVLLKCVLKIHFTNMDIKSFSTLKIKC